MKYSFNSKIRFSEVDKDCRLTLNALTNYFQDCSVFHSDSVGNGMEYLSEQNLAWILSSWQVYINRMPRINENVKISTWAYDMKAFYGYRNFMMETEEGEVLAYANSIWILMDVESGRPQKVPEEFGETYGLEPKLDVECHERKISVPKDMEKVGEIVVPSYFIDTNQHMNNEKYIMLAQNVLPEDYEIKELRVEYKKEAKLGDLVNIFVNHQDDRVTVLLADEQEKPYAVVAFLK